MRSQRRGRLRKGRTAIGYERSLERLIACARTAHTLQARQRSLEQAETDMLSQARALSARQRELKAERRRVDRALRETDRARWRMERFLQACAEGTDLELLTARHVRGLTVPELQAWLAERDRFYGQRHVERLLYEAEQRVFPQWETWEREEELRDRAHRANEPV